MYIPCSRWKVLPPFLFCIRSWSCLWNAKNKLSALRPSSQSPPAIPLFGSSWLVSALMILDDFFNVFPMYVPAVSTNFAIDTPINAVPAGLRLVSQ